MVKAFKLETSKASVIMLNWNRLTLLKQTFDSLEKNTRFPYDLIVVDNGSWDGSVTWLKEMRRKNRMACLILLPENYGVGKAQNHGLIAAQQFLPKNRYLVLIGNDMLYPSNWLSKACNLLDNIPNIGLVMTGVEGASTPHTGKIKEINGVQYFIVSFAHGVFCFTKETLKKTGCVYDLFEYYSCHDIEFARRIRANGLTCVMMENVKVKQIHASFTLKDGRSLQEFKLSCRAKNLKTLETMEPLTHYKTKLTFADVKQTVWYEAA